jgi:hypothetical protein
MAANAVTASGKPPGMERIHARWSLREDEAEISSSNDASMQARVCGRAFEVKSELLKEPNTGAGPCKRTEGHFVLELQQ